MGRFCAQKPPSAAPNPLDGCGREERPDVALFFRQCSSSHGDITENLVSPTPIFMPT